MRLVVTTVLIATVSATFDPTHYETSYLNGNQQRVPTWADWEYLRTYWSDRINDSTCPDEGSEDLKTHWDYNYQDFINAGMTEEEALQQDCELFHRERNPRSMGSRLVRHMFHDAAGGFDGFVNIHDLIENGALDGSQKVLIDTYDTLLLEDLTPVNEVLSFADHVAWAGHAALYRAALNVDGSATRIDDGDVVPPVTINWGRRSYLNTTADETGPPESFPPSGGGGAATELITYFNDFFDLTEREVVTLLGVHTFGGGRRSASGYAGMWTQSKNQFNTDYQLQLVYPLPVVCTPGNCTYFSLAGTNKDSVDTVNRDLMTQCVATTGDDAERCLGWEQIRMAPFENNPPKFQWRHSCKHYNADGDNDVNTVEDCTHLMLNIDMALYRDLDGHICTADDELNQVPATLGRTCVEGMIKSYADATCESNKATQRVLATCFNVRTNSGSYLEHDAANFEDWIHDFAPLFDMLLSYNLTGDPTLTILETPSLAPTETASEAPTATPVCRDVSRWEHIDAFGDLVKCRHIAQMTGSTLTAACNWIGSTTINGVTTESAASESCPLTCGTCSV